MQTKTTEKAINLKTIGLLLSSSDAITSNLPSDGKILTGNELKDKFPKLQKLADTPLIKVIPTDTGVTTLIPTVYRHDDDVVVVLPDINASITNDFEIESWEAGDYNRAVLKHKEIDISLIGNIAYSNVFLEQIRVERDNHIKSDDVAKLNTQWLQDAPRLEHHLTKLPTNEKITILGISSKRSEKYNTLLVDLKTNSGKVYKNVITNSALRNLVADDIQQFKIVDIKPMSTKNQSTAKQQDRATLKVFLEPIVNADLSDL